MAAVTFDQKLSSGMLTWASAKEVDPGATADELKIADSIVRQNTDFSDTQRACAFWCYALGFDDNTTQADFDTGVTNAINATLGIWTAGRP